MKHAIILLLCLMLCNFAFGQTDYYDYTDGKRFTVEGVTYSIENHMGGYMDRAKSVGIIMEDVNNFRFETFGQYADGTFVKDDDTQGDTRGVIISRPYYRSYIYSALRKAFTKEELAAHGNSAIILYTVVDNQGNILETASYFRITKKYVIQPEQIATLERELRKNLKFELNQEKARKLNYFQGQITILFKHYANFVEVELPNGGGLTPVDGKPAAQP